MYLSQIKSGGTYDTLKKCITINIVDFECVEINKLHTKYHLKEDEVGELLTDLLEIHFMELPKAKKLEEVRDQDDPIVEWLRFLNAKSKEEMEVLAHQNKSIANAYEVLQVVSQNEENRKAYEAREAEIKDQLTRLKAAEERGIERGIELGINQGINRGISRGINQGLRDSVIDFLSDIGEVTPEIKDKIANENDTMTLKKWNKIAGRATHIEEFLSQIAQV